MSVQLRAFRPLGKNQTVSILTTGASQTLTIPASPLGTRSVRIANIGTDISYIEFTDAAGAAAAVATSMPMLGNTVEVFLLQNDNTQVRVIGAAGGSTLYVTYGEGL